MGNYEQHVTLGSGITPSILTGPAHGLSRDRYPTHDQRHSLRTQRADGVAIMNPENFSANLGIRSQAINVTTSATPLPANPLIYRRALVIHNGSAGTIYIGDSSVTVAQGLPIAAGEKIAFDIQGNPNVMIYAIADSTLEVRIMEVA